MNIDVNERQYKEALESLMLGEKKEKLSLKYELEKFKNVNMVGKEKRVRARYYKSFFNLLEEDTNLTNINTKHIYEEYRNKIIGLNTKLFKFSSEFYFNLYESLSKGLKIDKYSNLEELLLLSVIKTPNKLSQEISNISSFIKRKTSYTSLSVEEKNKVLKIKDIYFKRFVLNQIVLELVKSETDNEGLIKYIGTLSEKIKDKISEILQNYLEVIALDKKEKDRIEDIFAEHRDILKYDYRRINKFKIEKLED